LRQNPIVSATDLCQDFRGFIAEFEWRPPKHAGDTSDVNRWEKIYEVKVNYRVSTDVKF
jgi:hypothetical protein